VKGTTNNVSQNQLHNCHLSTKIFMGIYYEQYCNTMQLTSKFAVTLFIWCFPYISSYNQNPLYYIALHIHKHKEKLKSVTCSLWTWAVV